MPVCPRDVDRKFLEKPTLPYVHGVAETEVGTSGPTCCWPRSWVRKGSMCKPP